MGNVTIVIHGNTAAFLSTVLKSTETVVRAAHTVAIGIINCEYTAFLTDFVLHIINSFIVRRMFLTP